MKRYLLIAVCLIMLGAGIAGAYIYQRETQPFFYIVSPSYNNEQWCIKSLESIVKQSYAHWKVVIVNDCSSDQTSALLHDYVREHHLEEKVLVVDNKKRVGALRNIYDAIHGSFDEEVHILPECPDNAIVAIVDGDDFLKNRNVLDRLVQEYSNPETWLTYGTYEVWPERIATCCAPLADAVMKNRLFRSRRWVTSHLRTFRAWLFKKVKKDDLMRNGCFYITNADLAITFPMLEMASQGHIKYISDILYIYNVATPLNDYKQRLELQMREAQYIRSLPRYEPLEG